MNRLTSASIALLAFVMGTAGVSAGTLTETENMISVDMASYRLEVEKTPFLFRILRNGQPVLQSNPTESYLQDVDRQSRLIEIKDWSGSDSLLQLVAVTGDSGPRVRVNFSLGEGLVDVYWQVEHDDEQDRIQVAFDLASGGHWYGGNVTSGHNWPLETNELVLDPFLATSNQTAPIWLTSSGTAVVVNGHQPLGFTINRGNDGLFTFNMKKTPRLSFQIVTANNIRDAFLGVVEIVGKPEIVPPKEYFSEPIFNTWIEFLQKVNQSDVEKYVKKIRQSRFPGMIFVLDDGWATRYGDFTFVPEKFPDPKAMVDAVHEAGFKFILWATPFIEPSAKNYGYAVQNGFLVMAADGQNPATARWWNGEAALVDLSNPRAYRWFLGELLNLQIQYGVDGFKLDAGDAEYFDPSFETYGRITPNHYTDLFASLGRHFEINELRVSWMVQRLGLVERLRDKNSDWNPATGLGALLPHSLTLSLIGYPYSCPDIIGGGLDSDFLDPKYGGMDPEMFVRWTQASALMPMMQFSYAPWKLDDRSVAICRRYSELHRDLGDYIYQLAQEASKSGLPIVRPLFFRNPEDEAAYSISDQFMLGDRFLVAPVLSKGATARDIYLPPGLWKDFWSGNVFKGGQYLRAHPAPIDSLPVFVAID